MEEGLQVSCEQVDKVESKYAPSLYNAERE